MLPLHSLDPFCSASYLSHFGATFYVLSVHLPLSEQFSFRILLAMLVMCSRATKKASYLWSALAKQNNPKGVQGKREDGYREEEWASTVNNTMALMGIVLMHFVLSRAA